MATKDSIGSFIIIAVAAVALVVSGIAADRKFLRPTVLFSSDDPVQEPTKIDDWKELIRTGHRFGAQSPTVTLLEFGDFQCPACKQFALHALRGIRARYPEDVAIVFRHWPLPYHQFAYSAARAAECAGAQGRFEAFHDNLYSVQDSLGIISYTALAQRSGVPNLVSFGKCSQDSTAVLAVEADILAAHQIGGRATPTIAINGLLLHMLPDSAGLDRLVQAQLSSVDRGP